MNITKEIQNLKCGGCAHTIITGLNNLDNINDVEINVEKSLVSFRCLTEVDEQSVYKKLKEIGYPIVGEDNSFGLKAKSYISCAIGKIKK